MNIKMSAKSLIITAITVIGFSLASFTEPGERFFEIAKNLDIYATLFKELNRYYVDEINPNKTIKTSIDAMLKSFDPYTVYYAEDEIEDYMTMTTGKYNGIGIVTGNRNGKIVIMLIDEGTPAEKSGLRIGDEIVKVDGVDLAARKINDAGKLIKGQTGTAVRITVKRYGTDKLEEVSIVRDVVKMKNVPYYGMINNEVGYIDLKDFTGTASKEVRTAFTELKGKGMKKLVLDLRENPGGLLNMAVDICNIFLPKESEIVSTKGKVEDWNKTYVGLNAAIDTEMPITVLTNSRSASAAEIVAGVIQDYDRGVLIGQRSYGKGLVQITRDLTYNTKLKVTTAKYYIPSGRCIQAIDYSHRNPDGSVGKLPDSLRRPFKTVKSGRVVYDGGGILPDIEVDRPYPAAVTLALSNRYILFDYAIKYHFEHPSIKPAKDFELTNAEYNDFVKWAVTQDFDYTTQAEKDLNLLEASAKRERYYENISEQLKSLRNKLSHSKEADIMKFKDEIKTALEQEIVVHYYLQRGTREQSFAKDPEIQEALKLFTDMPRYQSILKGN
ncbi:MULTISPECIES: S41 family peptidase [unclassified Arcicella]|uniref:S41 family peptidase n=1 Tax=unclassified Arcicella TaxID=2644986 RepID=UPI002859EEEA|nr:MULTISPECIES: S41 family peptidase [unclassified Arcicella]MDR6563709.1 carboxyl-terminal processing protease [Arcicella sp. BE51]MDR6814769.1 carboxyl-terminal processing protease [Arcicella sp. BE140]MDR6826227.1 carboxyl-terminal processing protease [Arcicella sp. BE139]